jgi:hypothetical protein
MARFTQLPAMMSIFDGSNWVRQMTNLFVNVEHVSEVFPIDDNRCRLVMNSKLDYEIAVSFGSLVQDLSRNQNK